MKDSYPVALIDLDGTLCNYVDAMLVSLRELTSPDEFFVDPFVVPDGKEKSESLRYLWARMNLIKSDEFWWANLPKMQLGFDVLGVLQDLGFDCEILTQSPMNNPAALAGKLRWIRKHLGSDMEYTMTRQKGRHQGAVFVDDYPEYIKLWLAHNKDGLVIMPANKYNKDFSHPQVIRYTGDNKVDVSTALKKVFEKNI